MGYTHYWDYRRSFSDIEWASLTSAVSRMIEHSCLPVRFEYDSDEPPELSGDTIGFNGVWDDGHETFVLHRQPDPTDQWGFCKTARKPYDTLVVATLIVAAHIGAIAWSSDGDKADHVAGIQLASLIEVPYTQGAEKAGA